MGAYRNFHSIFDREHSPIEHSPDSDGHKVNIPVRCWSNYYVHDYSPVKDAVKLIYEAAVELAIAHYKDLCGIDTMPIRLGVHISGDGYVEDKNGRYCFREQFNADGSRIRYSYEDNIVPIETERLRMFIERLKKKGDKNDPHIQKAMNLLNKAYSYLLYHYVHASVPRNFQPLDDTNVHLCIDNVDGNIMLYGEYYGPEVKESNEKVVPQKLYSDFSTDGISIATLKKLAQKGYFVRVKNRCAICPDGKNMKISESKGNGGENFHYPYCCKDCRKGFCIGKAGKSSLYFGINTYIKDISGKVLPDALMEVKESMEGREEGTDDLGRACQ